MGNIVKEALNQTTTSDYVRVIHQKIPPGATELVIDFKEKDTNAVKYKILVGQKETDVNREIGATDEVILKNGNDYQVVCGSWVWVDVYVADNASGSHGIVDVIVSA